MKLERLTRNKIKFSIGVDELEAKGMLNENFLKESLIWHELFEEMLEQIQDKYGIDSQVEVTVEVHSFNEQEVQLILTLEIDEQLFEDEIHSYSLEYIQCEIFAFEDFEAVISFSRTIKNKVHCKSISLYSFKEIYYIVFEKLIDKDYVIEAVANEFGSKAKMTIEYLDDYGKLLIENDLIETLERYFKN